MADGMTMRVHGLVELERTMKELGPKLARNALRSAVNAGAQVIKKEAQGLAPIDTGRLAQKAIYVTRSRSDSGPGKETYLVGVRQGRREQQKDRDAFYWKFVEFGTKFVHARPFLRPAFENKKVEAVARMTEKLKKALERLANKK
jgi:HK97 gp10 family phage protein